MPSRRTFLGGLGGVLASLGGCRAPQLAAPASAQPPPAPLRGDADWREIRRHFLVPEGYVYCNTGTLGASPREVVDATLVFARRLEENLVRFDYHDDPEPPLSGYDKADKYRDMLARFVGASTDEIALTQNATMGMNFIAQGIDIASGDEVVTTDMEHPGGICPWQSIAKRRGATVKMVPIKATMSPPQVLQVFSDALTPKTRVVWASHMTSGLGLLLPGKQLCKLAHDKGAIAVLDGAQVLGQLAIDVHDLGCDYYVSSPHKWLCAPKGTGMLYVKREMLDRTWTTLASSQWENKEWGAARLGQFGTGNAALLHGLEAAIDFQNAIGRARIEERDRQLTRRLRDGLAKCPKVKIRSSVHPEMFGAVTSFSVEGRKPKEVQDALWQARVRVREISEDFGVRCGTHVYVLDEDVDRIVDVVRKL